jgi:hypothetical protein
MARSYLREGDIALGQLSQKGTYKLEEFDGTPLSGTFAGNRLKKFVKHEGTYEPKRLASEQREEGSEGEGEEGRGELSGDPFEMVVAQLTEGQRRDYVRYDDDEVCQLFDSFVHLLISLSRVESRRSTGRYSR